jgi:hypothetical protein
MARSLKASAKYLVATCMLLARAAHADSSAADLQARGEQLAKDGRFADAIDAFKAADHVELRASHACLIALAYTRRELWPQAEVWLDTCQKRVRPDDPLPEWGAELEATIARRLADTNVAAVDIRVQPREANARLAVSSFAPDETFAPRTIHLPPGHHVILAKAPGYVDAEATVDVIDKSQQHVVIALVAKVTPSDLQRTLVIAGAALAIAGAGTYGWMSYEWLHEERARTHSDYVAPHDNYERAKWATIGLWSASALCIAVRFGIVHGANTPEVAVGPADGGVLVGIGWRR